MLTFEGFLDLRKTQIEELYRNIPNIIFEEYLNANAIKHIDALGDEDKAQLAHSIAKNYVTKALAAVQNDPDYDEDKHLDDYKKVLTDVVSKIKSSKSGADFNDALAHADKQFTGFAKKNKLKTLSNDDSPGEDLADKKIAPAVEKSNSTSTEKDSPKEDEKESKGLRAGASKYKVITSSGQIRYFQDQEKAQIYMKKNSGSELVDRTKK